MKILEDYVAYKDFRDDKFTQGKHLIAGLRKRNVKKAFNKKINQTKDDLEDEKLRDNRYFYNKFLLATEADRYFLMNNLIERNNSIRERKEFLDLFYFSTKLRDSTKLISRQLIIDETYDMTLTRDLIKVIESNHEKYLKHPAIENYLNIFKLFDNPENGALYEKCKNSLKNSIGLFPPIEQKSLYESLINYCVGRINAGNNSFMTELFKLYKMLLKRDILLESGYLSQWTYLNISTLAQRLNKFNWTDSFLEDHKDKLPPEHRENAFITNSANLHFSKGEYKEALFLLHQVEFVDISYALTAKSVLLKSYYELMEVESFPHLVKSFQDYIRRNKLMSDNVKTIYSNSIKYTRILFDLKLKIEANKRSIESDKLDKLRSKIIEEKNTGNKNWIIEKLEELYKKVK
jgi:hypothetical protein